MDTLQSKMNDNVEVKVPRMLIDLIPQYLKNRRDELRTLKEAFSNKNFQFIQDVGHKLKGNAGSYGFEYLTEIGMNLENAARSQDATAITGLIKSYDDYLTRIKIIPA